MLVLIQFDINFMSDFQIVFPRTAASPKILPMTVCSGREAMHKSFSTCVIKTYMWLGVGAHTFNPNTKETEACGSPQVWSQHGLYKFHLIQGDIARPCLNNKIIKKHLYHMKINYEYNATLMMEILEGQNIHIT